MIDVTSYQEYLRENGYGENKEDHKRHVWCSGEMADKINELIFHNDGETSIELLAQVIPSMPQRFSRWFEKISHKFFFELADFLKLDAGDAELYTLLQHVKSYQTILFQNRAARVVRNLRDEMLPIPQTAQIEPQWLGELTNEQFVQAFGELQGIFIGAYIDIEQDAFSWGFPSAYSTEPDLRRRLGDVMVTLGCTSAIKNNVLTVESVHFKGMLKNRRKIPQVIAGLQSLGLEFGGYTPKAETFTVAYPDNPHVIWVLKQYAERYCQGFCRRCQGCTRAQGKCPKRGLEMTHHQLCSYRYMENTAHQHASVPFHVETDRFNDFDRDIVLWLYDNAEDYGYQLNPRRDHCHDMLAFSRTDAVKCCDRSKCILFGYKDDKHIERYLALRIRLANAFSAAPSKISALAKRFPQTFQSFDDEENSSSCCHDRPCNGRHYFTVNGEQRYVCKHSSFIFREPNADDVKSIMELLQYEQN